MKIYKQLTMEQIHTKQSLRKLHYRIQVLKFLRWCILASRLFPILVGLCWLFLPDKQFITMPLFVVSILVVSYFSLNIRLLTYKIERTKLLLILYRIENGVHLPMEHKDYALLQKMFNPNSSDE